MLDKDKRIILTCPYNKQWHCGYHPGDLKHDDDNPIGYGEIPQLALQKFLAKVAERQEENENG